jgi:hypothetical protein
MDAEQLRNLVHHDHQPDARLETGEHGFGNEVRQETETQCECGDKHRTDEYRQCRAGHDQFARICIRRHAPQFGRRENGDGRCRADAERSRCSQQRIDDHRHEDGIEADLHRQSCDGGVGHRLGNDNGSRCEACNDIGPQPLLLVSARPPYPRYESRTVAAFSVGLRCHLFRLHRGRDSSTDCREPALNQPALTFGTSTFGL